MSRANAVGVVKRNFQLVLATGTRQYAPFGGVDHVVAKNTGPKLGRVNMQAMKVQVGAVLMVQVTQL